MQEVIHLLCAEELGPSAEDGERGDRGKGGAHVRVLPRPTTEPTAVGSQAAAGGGHNIECPFTYFIVCEGPLYTQTLKLRSGCSPDYLVRLPLTCEFARL
jgi:hypothetical protein